jgi:hypothetical protein
MTDPEQENYIITFFFSCGKSQDVQFQKDKMQELFKNLARGWNTCSTIGQEFGMNFAQVTHYKVKRI